MAQNKHPQLTLAVYSGEEWAQACPVVRITGPARAAGLELMRGNQWENGEMSYSLDPIDQADLVLIMRDFPRWEEAYQQIVSRARLHNKKIVYMTDDLLTDLPLDHPNILYFRFIPNLIVQAILDADALIVSMPQLGSALNKYNERIFVLPNYLDDQLWRLAPAPAHTDPQPVVIGFQGGDGHKPDLEMITPALVKILERYPGRVQLKFWGVKPPAGLIDHPNVEWLLVDMISYAEFAEYFQRQECDIFIGPLMDNEFNTSKSPLKFLEYSSMGVPGVYSSVPTFASVITHGVNGMLASSLQEWEESIAQLIDSREMRVRVGKAAQDLVREKWLLSRHVEAWRQAFAEILALPVRPPQPAIVWDLVADAHRRTQEMGQTIMEQHIALDERQNAINDLTGEISKLNLEIQDLRTDINNIKGSTGWKALSRVNRTIARLLPPNSPPGKIFHGSIARLKRIFRRG